MFKQMIELHKFNKQFKIEHPDYFYEDGITVYCGVQGSGKTLSAVRRVVELLELYPKSIAVSNVIINREDLKERILPWRGLESLKIQNGEYGVIYLIDEMHLIFNSLESKQIPIEVFSTISQQRKQRKKIIGTSQLFLRMAKPFREQVAEVVFCSPCFFGFKILNEIVDGSEIYETPDGVMFDSCKTISYYKSPELFNLYDTYAIIERGSGSYSLYDTTTNTKINRKKRGVKNGY